MAKPDKNGNDDTESTLKEFTIQGYYLYSRFDDDGQLPVIKVDGRHPQLVITSAEGVNVSVRTNALRNRLRDA